MQRLFQSASQYRQDLAGRLSAAREGGRREHLDTGLVFWSTLFSLAFGLLFTAIYAGWAFALWIVWAIAWFSVGNAIGFLFGVPRARRDRVVASGTKEASSGPGVNTNLEEISDWVTKIIVGVSLIEFRQIITTVRGLSEYMAGGPVAPPAMKSFALAVLLFFSLCGFMYG